MASGPNATLAPPVSQLGSLPVPAAGKWVVEVGSFDDDSALGKVLQLLHSLGFEPQVSRVLHEVPMVRLRLGEYPSADVQRALATARRVAPDAFALPEGDQFTVYAGTYARRDNVHQMIERLSAKGIQVEEEPVLVKRTVSLVRIGNFADQAEAEEAATKVRSGGVRAKVAMPR